MKRLYVGNLAPSTSAADIEYAFSKFGRVLSVTLAENRHSGRHRAFAYVEMEDGESAAVAALNRQDLGGQPLTVCSAVPKNETSGSSATREPAARSYSR